MSTDPYAGIKAHFTQRSDVTVNAGRGSQGLKVAAKLVAMFYKGRLVVKLPPARVAELIETGVGVAFDPGTGKAMKDRVAIPQANRECWIDLCEEAVAAAVE